MVGVGGGEGGERGEVRREKEVREGRLLLVREDK